MAQLDKERVYRILEKVIDPHTDSSLAAATRAVGIVGSAVSVDVHLGYPANSVHHEFALRIKQALEADVAITTAVVSVTCRVYVHRVQSSLAPLPNIKNYYCGSFG